MKRVDVERTSGPDACFYLDPPYEPTTRRRNKQRGNRSYNYELTSEDHQEIVARALRLEGAVVISGYEHESYEPLTRAGFMRREFDAIAASANAAGADARRREVLWTRGEERLFAETAA